MEGLLSKGLPRLVLVFDKRTYYWILLLKKFQKKILPQTLSFIGSRHFPHLFHPFSNQPYVLTKF